MRHRREPAASWYADFLLAPLFHPVKCKIYSDVKHYLSRRQCSLNMRVLCQQATSIHKKRGKYKRLHCISQFVHTRICDWLRYTFSFSSRYIFQRVGPSYITIVSIYQFTVYKRGKIKVYATILFLRWNICEETFPTMASVWQIWTISFVDHISFIKTRFII